MRETIARLVCGVTVGVVIALAWLFAVRHNPPSAPQAPHDREVAVPALDPDLERGRSVYVAHDCASCHAIAGRGNPRHPLDGVGTRRTPAELRQFVTATGKAATALSGAVTRRKAKYREMPEEEMADLIRYLSSLSAAK